MERSKFSTFWEGQANPENAISEMYTPRLSGTQNQGSITALAGDNSNSDLHMQFERFHRLHFGGHPCSTIIYICMHETRWKHGANCEQNWMKSHYWDGG